MGTACREYFVCVFDFTLFLALEGVQYAFAFGVQPCTVLNSWVGKETSIATPVYFPHRNPSPFI